MLARTAPEPFDDPDWLFEVKWDGYRAIAKTGDRTQFFGRRQELTALFPEFSGLGKRGGPAVLDGEIVALDPSGRPDFFALRRRGRHVFYVGFDLLEENGRSLLEASLAERREHLDAVMDRLDDDRLLRPVGVVGEGKAFFRAAREMALEGIVAKRLDSRYRPGVRSPHWLKILNGRETVVDIPSVEETAAHEWVAEAREGGAPRGRLRVPRPEADGELFKDVVVTRRGRTFFFDPPLRAEVRFRELTPDGQFRHGVLKRLLPP